MLNVWTLSVNDVRPRPWPRPRPRFRGKGFITLWTPFHERIRQEAKNIRPKKPFAIALKMTIVSDFPYPSKWRKAQRCGIHPHTSVPDVDNLIKGVGDMLEQAGVIEDDKFIFEVTGIKQYNSSTGVLIQLKPYREDAWQINAGTKLQSKS